jgi:hypothetical protein
VVIKNTFLSNTDNASVSLRSLLLGKLQSPHPCSIVRKALFRARASRRWCSSLRKEPIRKVWF